METKYFRKGMMIFGVFRGETKKVPQEIDGKVKEVDQYFPHDKEGEPNFQDVIFSGKSLNEAKRESRKLQGESLGMGTLRVIRA